MGKFQYGKTCEKRLSFQPLIIFTKKFRKPLAVFAEKLHRRYLQGSEDTPEYNHKIYIIRYKSML